MLLFSFVIVFYLRNIIVFPAICWSRNPFENSPATVELDRVEPGYRGTVNLNCTTGIQLELEVNSYIIILVFCCSYFSSLLHSLSRA